jgi:hypothetical protein
MTTEERDKIILTAFVKFLKANDAFVQYRANYVKGRSGYRAAFFPLHNHDCRTLSGMPRSFIITAFSWEETKEGRAFWSNLHYKWGELLTILERNNYEISKNISPTFFTRCNEG